MSRVKCFWAIAALLAILALVSGSSSSHVVHRMQHLDLLEEPIATGRELMNRVGSRLAPVNLRAAAAGPGTSTSFSKHCVFIKLADLSAAYVDELVNERGAGAVVVLVPVPNPESPPSLPDWQARERNLIRVQVRAPVYFVREDKELSSLYKSLSTGATPKRSVLAQATASSFVVNVETPEPSLIQGLSARNLKAQLSGSGAKPRKSIVVMAHYDAFGVAPTLSNGVDSNGSGVIALLELARIFSRLYSDAKTHAEYDLTFLLTGGGKVNFVGATGWATKEVPKDNDIEFVICLDSIGSGLAMHFHVSKPPAEDSPLHGFLTEMQAVGKALTPTLPVTVVQRKINIRVPQHSWEHEPLRVFRGLNAATLSHYPAAGDSGDMFIRSSIQDTSAAVSVKALARNVRVVGEALARHVYKIGDKDFGVPIQVLSGALDVDSDFISSWCEYLESQPRSVQNVDSNMKFLRVAQGLLRNKYGLNVTTSEYPLDAKKFAFYNGATATMAISMVKPALFDFALLLFVGAYLVGMYFVIQMLSPFMSSKAKTN